MEGEARNLGEQKPNHLSEERKSGIEEACREAEPQGLGGRRGCGFEKGKHR